MLCLSAIIGIHTPYLIVLIYIHSAITLTLSTSILSKKQWDALPDLQIAFLSAKRFIMMTSTQPVIDDFSGGGIIPVSISIL